VCKVGRIKEAVGIEEEERMFVDVFTISNTFKTINYLNIKANAT
jgi:hypothetical protein